MPLAYDKGESPSDKFEGGTWLSIQQWRDPQAVETAPWKFLPHLHPDSKTIMRRVDTESDQGSLFLENAIQLDRMPV
jgi:CRISPR-associated protein Cmr3